MRGATPPLAIPRQASCGYADPGWAPLKRRCNGATTQRHHRSYALTSLSFLVHSGDAMQVRLLGPIDITVDGQARAITGLRRKALVAPWRYMPATWSAPTV